MEFVVSEVQENLRQNHASEGQEIHEGTPENVYEADKQALRDSTLYAQRCVEKDGKMTCPISNKGICLFDNKPCKDHETCPNDYKERAYEIEKDGEMNPIRDPISLKHWKQKRKREVERERMVR